MARVALAMSGGVDSSVAASLLREAGHEVIGLFMRHGAWHASACAAPSGEVRSASEFWNASKSIATLPIVQQPARESSHRQGCCSASDAEDARRVADRLDIPFYALDLADDFAPLVDYFVGEYAEGRTPNPCVVCNNWLKFGKLWEHAQSVGASHVATGHYARIVTGASGEPQLHRGVDPDKDQSYVLFGLARSLLSRVMLPVGEFRKSEIRARARALGLRVADKKDSQEICFVPDDDYAALVRSRLGPADRRGEIVSTSGRHLGWHEGIENFTIGQRKGLGVAVGHRQYVVRIEVESRRVVVGERHELARQMLTASRANWLGDCFEGPRLCQVKIRYNGPAASGQVEALPDDRLRVTLDEPRHGVAPGQAVVCYDGTRVLVGGWIESS